MVWPYSHTMFDAGAAGCGAGRPQHDDRARIVERERLRHEIVLAADAADDLTAFDRVGNDRAEQRRHHGVVDEARLDPRAAFVVLVAV